MISKPTIQTAIEEKYTNAATTQVLGEWNMIRYTTITSDFPRTTQTDEQKAWGADRGYDGFFPITTITRPQRDPGIIYSTLYDSWGTNYSAQNQEGVNTIKFAKYSLSETKRTDNKKYPRCYMAGKRNNFQYWISGARTLAKTDGNGRTPGQFSCELADSSRALRVAIEFDSAVDVNKLVAKMNTHIANPQDIKFEVKISGSWTTVATGIDCPDNGVVEIYRPAAGGTWTTTPVYYTTAAPNSVSIQGIRMSVDSMLRILPSGATENAVNASLELIEFTPRLVIDLTERTESYETTIEIGNDTSELSFGEVTTNTGSITFSNDDGFMDTVSSASILNGKLDSMVEFKVDLVYDSSIGGTLAQRTVRQLTMLSDTWSSEGQDTTTVNLVDYSKVLQESKAQETLVTKIPAYAAIWLLCDGVGFNRVDVSRSTATEDDYMIEWFWAKSDKTVWEYIQEIARSFQLAVHFDAFGRLQVVTRKYLFDRNSELPSGTASDLTLYGVNSGNKISNIISDSRNESEMYNWVKVKYKAANKYVSSRGHRRSSSKILWQGDDPMVVGAADIVQSFAQGATQIKIKGFDDSLFKHRGKFVVEDTGKVYEYDAKKYSLFGGGSVWVSSDTDMIYAIEQNNGIRPTFTGWIRLSEPAAAGINAIYYDFRQSWKTLKFAKGSGTGQNDMSPIKFVRRDTDNDKGGYLKITTSFTGGSRYKIWKDNESYDKYDRVGVKFKFADGDDPEIGVVIFPTGNHFAGGYHISVAPQTFGSNGIDGDKINLSTLASDVNVVRVNGTGGEKQIPKDISFIQYANYRKEKTYEAPRITKSDWIYLEVLVTGNEKDWNFDVFINGNFVGQWSDKSDAALSRTRKAQFFVKGDGKVLVDKFYVVNTVGFNDYKRGYLYNMNRKDRANSDKAAPGDKLFHKYVNDYLKKKFDARAWVYNFNHGGWATAREIAHYNAEFEMPAISQKIYSSNKSVGVTRYNKRPMGAGFTLHNRSEKNQLVNGERETDVANARRNESLFITAKTLFLGAEQELDYKDKDLIDQFGEKSLEITGEWLQRRESAEDIGKFIRNRFGTQTSNYELEIYGNPLIEVGDIVSVYWPGKRIATYTYVVTKVAHSWDNGLSTTISIAMRAGDPPEKTFTTNDDSIDVNAIRPPGFYQISADSV